MELKQNGKILVYAVCNDNQYIDVSTNKQYSDLLANRENATVELLEMYPLEYRLAGCMYRATVNDDYTIEDRRKLRYECFNLKNLESYYKRVECARDRGTATEYEIDLYSCFVDYFIMLDRR